MQSLPELPFSMPFADLLNIQVTQMQPEQVKGELQVRPELCTTGARMHGGALMAFADNLGAIAAFLNLPEGKKATTTLESKTNFLGAAKVGELVFGETILVHIGRRTSVWQTKITTAAGKSVAVITQTQLVL